MHGDLFADNEAIGHKFVDRLTRVGVGDFVNFIWVKPDLTLAAANDRSCESFLSAQIDPRELL